MKSKKIYRCTNCLNVSTRDRIEFDEKGWCNACQWVEEKKEINWDRRWKELVELCEKNKSKTGGFDCIVPVSGGKDGSYVAHTLKNKLGMNPLAVTIKVPMSMQLGDENLHNFTNSGFSHILLSPNMKLMREMNINGFKKYGRPILGWQTFVHTAIRRLAIQFNIPLIFFGENGDVEYGGSSSSKNTPYVETAFAKETYLSGTYEGIMPSSDDYTDVDKFWLEFPSEQELDENNLKYTHWSYFENWDPYAHYLVAKEHCGLKDSDESSSGTYTNFAQTDSYGYDLHVYLMNLDVHLRI